MRTHVLSLLPWMVLAGCTCAGERPSASPEPPPAATPAWQGAPLTTTGATTLHLDEMAATFALPEHDVDAEGADTYVLTEFRPRRAGGRMWATAPLPFRVPRAQRRFAPKGMKVFVDGEEATFLAIRAAGSPPFWRFLGPNLAVSGKAAEVGEVVIHHPKAAAKADRLTWSEAKGQGYTPQTFTAYDVTFEKDAREGLLLPAPSSATWSGVTLPDGARFTSHLALAPSPLANQSDGAAVVLSLRTEAGLTELARGEVGPGASFTPFSADLSAHAGATGDLILATEPGASDVGDHVFVAAPKVEGTPEGPVRRVVVIGIDTQRPDHLGVYGYPLPTSPEIDAWARDAVVFDNAWTPAPRTRPSFRTSTTGRLPLEAVCAPKLAEVFSDHGFATAGIVANVHLNPRFGFHVGSDLWTLDTKAKASDQVGLAIDWLQSHQHHDSFLFLHLMDPHLFYVAPDAFEAPFVGALDPLPDGTLPKIFNRENIYRMMRQGTLTDLAKQHVIARYDAEVAYTSSELGKLFATLETLPGETVVVIHSDHGEELFEHGGFEHNHTLYDEVTKAVFIIKPPGGSGTEGARSPAMASLQDIGPTLFDLLGMDDVPTQDGISLVPALRGDAMDPERPIPVAHLKYDADRWGVVWKGHKYIQVTGTGAEELYDLNADPGEQHDLAGEVDTFPWVQALARSHGVAAGHGWRVHVDLDPGSTWTLHLPQPAVGADVMHPEAVSRRPVNQVWGETPPVLPEDVGEVELSDDRTTVTIHAGERGDGIVWVLFPEQPGVDGVEATKEGGERRPLASGRLSVQRETIRIEPGHVVVPPDDEAARMASCATGPQDDAAEDEPEDDDTCMLCCLGYMSGPDCADCACEGGAPAQRGD